MFYYLCDLPCHSSSRQGEYSFACNRLTDDIAEQDDLTIELSSTTQLFFSLLHPLHALVAFRRRQSQRGVWHKAKIDEAAIVIIFDLLHTHERNQEQGLLPNLTRERGEHSAVEGSAPKTSEGTAS